MFPSFFDRPEKIFFELQESDEKIELLLRRHWVTNIGWILTAIILLFLPALFPYLFIQLQGLFPIPPVDIVMAILIFWYLLVLAYVTENFLSWYFNIYIVTNQHLIDVNFHNLLNKDIVSVQIQDVQSVKPQVKGVFGSVFNYGDLVIETAAENQRIEFSGVPRPDLVADRIQDLQEDKEDSQNGGNDEP